MNSHGTSPSSLLRLLGVPGLAFALGIPAPAAQTPDQPAAQVAKTPAGTFDPARFADEGRRPDLNFSYKNVGDLDLPMAVFLPKDRTTLTPRRPAILAIHGGAWSGWKGGDCTAWDGGVFAPHARFFADRGAVAVTISYRNIPQPGKDLAAFNAGPSLFDLQSDCRSAIRYLRQHADRFGIDPDRIAVIGDSAGGHLAATLGTIDRYDAPGEDRAISGLANLVIACNPIVDLTDPAWVKYVHETPSAWEGTQPFTTREDRAKAISPLWNVTPASAPTLTIHGLKDGVVAPRHATDFHEALKKVGVASDITLLPEASHAFILLGYKSNGADFLAVMGTIDRYLANHGYLSGPATFSGPSPRGRLGILPGDQIAEGQIPGTNGLALVLPDPHKPKVTTVQIANDAQRGQVLKLSKGAEGLLLTGSPNLGTSTSVSLWIQPEKGPGNLVRRSIGNHVATGFLLALGKQGEVTLNVAGQTLTGPVLPVGTWSHVLASVGGDRAALYLNGTVVAEQQLPGVVLIGSRLVIGEAYGGGLSDLRIFDQATEPEAAKAP